MVAEESGESLSPTFALARSFLDAVASRDSDTIWAMCSADVTFEWPFSGDRVIDRETFDEDVSPVLALLDGLDFTDLQIDPMLDPDSLVMRYRGTATITTTGKPYRQTYITQIQFNDGKVTLFREYYNTSVLELATQPDR